MKPILTSLLLCSLLSSGFAASPTDPANPKATASARAILKYFQTLSATPPDAGRRVLSGQFTDFGPGANLRLINQIHEQTGHWPALIGVDYADVGRGPLDYTASNRTARDYWNQGGLIKVSAHLYNPARTNKAGLRDKGVDLASLLDPVSVAHTNWMEELDHLAAGLQELRDAQVVVLWRPFHEMNGDWFWWGGKDPATFIKVWQHMFDYFSQTKGLDNLLWVYGPNHGKNTAAYYPGDAYVDLVGLDAYTDFVDPAHIRGYAEVAALPKPFGFSEYGPHGSEKPPGDYDYRRFLDGIKKDFPKTCFFMSWNAKWSLARNNHVQELLDDPWVINRENLPPKLVGDGK